MDENCSKTAGMDLDTVYKVASDDMRFLSDQRFKIMQALILAMGLLANIKVWWVSLIGIMLAFCGLMWDRGTSRRFYQLLRCNQAIEDAANLREIIPFSSAHRMENILSSIADLIVTKDIGTNHDIREEGGPYRRYRIAGNDYPIFMFFRPTRCVELIYISFFFFWIVYLIVFFK